MNAKDFLGEPLRVGDEVVYMEISYRSLKRGYVRSIATQTLTIERIPAAPPAAYRTEPVRQFHNQVMKVRP